MSEKLGQQVELLPKASLWLYVADRHEIEMERRWLQEEHGCPIKVFENNTITISGAPCTRVTWEIG